jgi:hypothetical protein
MPELFALKQEHEAYIALYEGMIVSQRAIIQAQESNSDFWTEREDRIGYLKDVLEGFERCFASTQQELHQVNQRIAALEAEMGNPVAHSCVEGVHIHQWFMKFLDMIFMVFDFFSGIFFLEHFMMISIIFIFHQKRIM